jgi:hypothetical protein
MEVSCNICETWGFITVPISGRCLTETDVISEITVGVGSSLIDSNQTLYKAFWFFFMLILFSLRKRYSYLPLCDDLRIRVDRRVGTSFCERTKELLPTRVLWWTRVYLRLSLRNWVRSGCGNKSKLDFHEDILKFHKYIEAALLSIWPPASVYLSSDAKIIHHWSAITYFFSRVISIYTITETCRILNILATHKHSHCRRFMERVMKLLQKNLRD